MMIPHQEIRPSDKGERSQSYVLGRITALQREWNALSATERASIAKESCDLTSFSAGAFRNPSIGGISGAHERNVACGIDKRRIHFCPGCPRMSRPSGSLLGSAASLLRGDS